MEDFTQGTYDCSTREDLFPKLPELENFPYYECSRSTWEQDMPALSMSDILTLPSSPSEFTDDQSVPFRAQKGFSCDCCGRTAAYFSSCPCPYVDQEKVMEHLNKLIPISVPRKRLQTTDSDFCAGKKQRVPSKFLDNLKKKPLKEQRMLLRAHIKGTRLKSFSSFTSEALKQSSVELERIMNSEYWPAKEWRADQWEGQTRAVYQTFTHGCIKDLLFNVNPIFYKLYVDLIEWYFNKAPEALLQRFLGVSGLTEEDKEAFQHYFFVVLPSKCLKDN